MSLKHFFGDEKIFIIRNQKRQDSICKVKKFTLWKPPGPLHAAMLDTELERPKFHWKPILINMLTNFTSIKVDAHSNVSHYDGLDLKWPT